MKYFPGFHLHDQKVLPRTRMGKSIGQPEAAMRHGRGSKTSFNRAHRLYRVAQVLMNSWTRLSVKCEFDFINQRLSEITAARFDHFCVGLIIHRTGPLVSTSFSPSCTSVACEIQYYDVC